MIVSIYGIGFNDHKYPSRVDGRQADEYIAWKSMLLRCTEKFLVRSPTYVGTTCSENFKYYSFFYEWCQTQVGFGKRDVKGYKYHLDKDLLIKGNKLYSEDTCCFVPRRINALLNKRKACRGELLVGVYWHKVKNKYMAQCNTGKGTQTTIGSYNTQEEAFLAYKNFKESVIKQVAQEYKSDLSTRVYEALIKYEIDSND